MDPRVPAACCLQVDPRMDDQLWVGPNPIATVGPNWVDILTRCGTSAIDGLNEALLAKAAQAKVLKTNKLRADTTVVPANVAYPTDSGLMAKGVAKMAKAIKSLQGKGLATRTKTRDRTKMMRKRARSIGANLRRRTNEAKDEVKAINAEMAALASKAVDEARRVVANARRALSQLGEAAPAKLERIARELEVTASRVERIAEQTRQRINGITPDGSTRLVSLHDPDARPIRKGRLGKPVEFGYKAQVVDNEDGVVVDHNVEMGNPPRRAHVGSRRRTSGGTGRQGPQGGDRRSRIRRRRRERRPPRHGRQDRRPADKGQTERISAGH
jgi:IS5 family transposase